MFPCFLLLLWLSSVRALLVDRPPRNEVSNPLTIEPNQAPPATAHFPEEPPFYVQGIPIDLCLTRANLDLDSSSCQLRRRVFFSSPIWRQRLGLFSLSSWRQHYGLQPINVRADPTTRTGLGFLRDLGSQPRKFFYLPPSQRANYLGLKLRPYDASSESQFFPAANASLSTFYFSNSSGQISYFLDSSTNVSPPEHYHLFQVPSKVATTHPSAGGRGHRSRLESQQGGMPVSTSAPRHHESTQARPGRPVPPISTTSFPPADRPSGPSSSSHQHGQQGPSGPQDTHAQLHPTTSSPFLPGSPRSARDNTLNGTMGPIRPRAIPDTRNSFSTPGSGVQPIDDGSLESHVPSDSVRTEPVFDPGHYSESPATVPAKNSNSRVKRETQVTFRTMQGYDCSNPQQATAIRASHLLNCPVTNYTAPELNSRMYLFI